MSLAILFMDELNGFYRSKVMLFLWAGLPVLAVFLYLMSPDTGSVPFSSFTAILVGSIGGVISAAMLAVGIINERERHVYDLFVIRPVKRRNIMLAKFLAVYVCIMIAGSIALLLGFGIDYLNSDLPLDEVVSLSLPGFIIIVAMMAISCSAGVLIGVFSPSVLVGVILVMYGANQLSAIVILPVLTASTDDYFPLLPGVAVTAALLFLAVLIFEKKQL